MHHCHVQGIIFHCFSTNCTDSEDHLGNNNKTPSIDMTSLTPSQLSAICVIFQVYAQPTGCNAFLGQNLAPKSNLAFSGGVPSTTHFEEPVGWGN